MAEDHREPTDECDFHEQESKSQAGEPGECGSAAYASGPFGSPDGEEWKQDEDDADDHGLYERDRKGEITDCDETDPALAAQGQDLRSMRPFEKVPEIRPVIGGGRISNL